MVLRVSLAVALVGGLCWFLLGHGSTKPPSHAGQGKEPDAPEAVPADPPSVKERAAYLAEKGWDEEAALAVCRLNDRWWATLAEAEPPMARLQVARLGHLTGQGIPWDKLREHPEWAGVFLACGEPSGLAGLLGGKDHLEVAALFAGCADPEDAQALLALLKEHRSAVVEAWRDMPGCEAVFLGNGERHTRWLAKEADTFRESGPDRLASFLQFAAAARAEVAVRIEKDEEAFLAAWDKLKKLESAKSVAFEDFIDVPHLWETLALPEGGELLATWQAAAPALLHRYPPDARKTVLRLLDAKDPKAVEGLASYCDDPARLKPLLRRDLSTATLRACLRRLREAGSDSPALLTQWARMTDPGLAKEVGDPQEAGALGLLPGWALYEIIEKSAEGREVGATEWGGAALDIGLTFVPAGKVASVAGKGAAKAATKEVAKRLAKEGAKAAGRLGTGAAKRLATGSARQRAAWGVSGLLGGMKRQLDALGKQADKAAAIDITAPLRFFAERSAWVRKTLRRVGLEARIFMRKDRRVRIHLLRAERQAKEAKERLDRVRDFFKPADKDDETSRKENNSAWWLAHATGQWDSIAGEDRP
ncbi:MAG: hypothetical protein K2W96_01220 [Gemmataceae bacterium]|nr:hypothetical protein [Gemmataceae bacterium]